MTYTVINYTGADVAAFIAEAIRAEHTRCVKLARGVAEKHRVLRDEARHQRRYNVAQGYSDSAFGADAVAQVIEQVNSQPQLSMIDQPRGHIPERLGAAPDRPSDRAG